MKHEQITAAFDKTSAKYAATAGLTKCEKVRWFLDTLNVLPLKDPIFRTARSLLRGYLEGWLEKEDCTSTAT